MSEEILVGGNELGEVDDPGLLPNQSIANVVDGVERLREALIELRRAFLVRPELVQGVRHSLKIPPQIMPESRHRDIHTRRFPSRVGQRDATWLPMQ